MNSAQKKMRTNGMFLRNFDSKRYQELQTQKQKILDKQKELIRIKDNKDKKEVKKKNISNGVNNGVNTVVNGITENVPEDNGSDIAEAGVPTICVTDDIPETSIVGPEALPESTHETIEETMRDSEGIIGSESKLEIEKENSENGDSTTGAISETSEKQNDMVQSAQELAQISENVSENAGETLGKVVKEYAIIAKLNKEAILRETELVVQKSEIVYAEINDSASSDNEKVNKVKTGNDVVVKETSSKGLKTVTDAYAIVDLDITMSLVNEINDEAEKIPESTESNKSIPGNVNVKRTGNKSNSMTNNENNYVRYQNCMSRSTGYHGDMDTSTSSIEPDGDSAVDQFLVAKFSVKHKERLVITEEQLMSLQYIGSSSSG